MGFGKRNTGDYCIDPAYFIGHNKDRNSNIGDVCKNQYFQYPQYELATKVADDYHPDDRTNVKNRKQRVKSFVNQYNNNNVVYTCTCCNVCSPNRCKCRQKGNIKCDGRRSIISLYRKFTTNSIKDYIGEKCTCLGKINYVDRRAQTEITKTRNKKGVKHNSKIRNHTEKAQHAKGESQSPRNCAGGLCTKAFKDQPDFSCKCTKNVDQNKDMKNKMIHEYKPVECTDITCYAVVAQNTTNKLISKNRDEKTGTVGEKLTNDPQKPIICASGVCARALKDQRDFICNCKKSVNEYNKRKKINTNTICECTQYKPIECTDDICKTADIHDMRENFKTKNRHEKNQTVEINEKRTSIKEKIMCLCHEYTQKNNFQKRRNTINEKRKTTQTFENEHVEIIQGLANYKRTNMQNKMSSTKRKNKINGKVDKTKYFQDFASTARKIPVNDQRESITVTLDPLGGSHNMTSNNKNVFLCRCEKRTGPYKIENLPPDREVTKCLDETCKIKLCDPTCPQECLTGKTNTIAKKMHKNIFPNKSNDRTEPYMDENYRNDLNTRCKNGFCVPECRQKCSLNHKNKHFHVGKHENEIIPNCVCVGRKYIGGNSFSTEGNLPLLEVKLNPDNMLVLNPDDLRQNIIQRQRRSNRQFKNTCPDGVCKAAKSSNRQYQCRCVSNTLQNKTSKLFVYCSKIWCNRNSHNSKFDIETVPEIKNMKHKRKGLEVNIGSHQFTSCLCKHCPLGKPKEVQSKSADPAKCECKEIEEKTKELERKKVAKKNAEITRIKQAEDKKRDKEYKKTIIGLSKVQYDGRETNIVAEIILGLFNLGLRSIKGLLKILLKIVVQPKESYEYANERFRDRVGTLDRLSKWWSVAWRKQKIRMVKSIKGSRNMEIIADTVQETDFYQAFTDKGKTPLEKTLITQRNRRRKKRIGRRYNDAIYGCQNMILVTLRKTPCLWVYHLWPKIYPQFLYLLNFWRHFTDMLMFCLALLIWTPCIVCFELCRGFMCCFLCTG